MHGAIDDSSGPGAAPRAIREDRVARRRSARSIRARRGWPIRAGLGGYGAPVISANAEDADRAAVLELLGVTAVPVDEIVRQSLRPPTIVQTVLLELELAGRLQRHAGGQVSLIG